MIRTNVSTLAGPSGEEIQRAMQAGRRILTDLTQQELLSRVGQTMLSVPRVHHVNKAVIQRSFGGGSSQDTDDLLVGRGVFYITERRRLFLDGTAGHYQMTWGYDHPVLTEALLAGIKNGVVWDNHSNIPQWPVKRLAQKLVELANPDRQELKEGDFSRIIRSRSRLNTVHLGLCTGSVACGAALKIMLVNARRTKVGQGTPVLVALEGNYHGTELLAQRMRGMWTELFQNLEIVTVQPNEGQALESAFASFGERIAGFWAEPVMMNREALVLEPEYLRLARRLCDRVGAVMVMDEIQTGFWWPKVFLFAELDIRPDIVVLGKGLSAGFHPLSGLIYKGHLDLLEQYDAISTNGAAGLPAYVALANIALIDANAQHIRELGQTVHESLAQLAKEFPDRISSVQGRGCLSGLKFRSREDAIDFHHRCMEDGLWVRVHAYHEGHSTVLTKLALCADAAVVDSLIGRLRKLLEESSGA